MRTEEDRARDGLRDGELEKRNIDEGETHRFPSRHRPSGTPTRSFGEFLERLGMLVGDELRGRTNPL
jgi:hypothetical protein